MLRGYLILIRFVAVIVISILASLFWNTLYIVSYCIIVVHCCVSQTINRPTLQERFVKCSIIKSLKHIICTDNYFSVKKGLTKLVLPQKNKKCIFLPLYSQRKSAINYTYHFRFLEYLCSVMCRKEWLLRLLNHFAPLKQYGEFCSPRINKIIDRECGFYEF